MLLAAWNLRHSHTWNMWLQADIGPHCKHKCNSILTSLGWKNNVTFMWWWTGWRVRRKDDASHYKNQVSLGFTWHVDRVTKRLNNTALFCMMDTKENYIVLVCLFFPRVMVTQLPRGLWSIYVGSTEFGLLFYSSVVPDLYLQCCRVQCPTW